MIRHIPLLLAWLLLSLSLQAKDAVSFLAMGDFGHPDENLRQVASAVERICSRKGCDFILGLGDNFYRRLPESDTDSLFQEDFEQPFAGIPQRFYMVLGNHDTVKNSDCALDSSPSRFQTGYHYSGLSQKWFMPYRYYSFEYPQKKHETLASFVALDSSPLGLKAKLNNHPELGTAFSTRQGQWLDKQLEGMAGRWKIAFAHHPFFSNGAHGNAGDRDRNNDIWGEEWRDFVRKHLCDKVDLLITGHDHNLQLLQAQPDICGKTLFAISGAGSEAGKLSMPDNNPYYWQLGNTLGFMHFVLSDGSMTVRIYVLDSRGLARLKHTRVFHREIPA